MLAGLFARTWFRRLGAAPLPPPPPPPVAQFIHEIERATPAKNTGETQPGKNQPFSEQRLASLSLALSLDLWLSYFCHVNRGILFRRISG